MQPYKNSGAIPLVRGTLSGIAILLAALIMGTANAYLVHWSPVNGIVFIVCVPVPFAIAFSFGCGGACGWIIGRLLIWGKIRNFGFEYAAIVGAVLAYFWAEWSTAQWASGWSPVQWESWLPDASLEFGRHLVARDGPILMVAWTLDVVLVALLIWFTARLRTHTPFCERCDRWTKLQTGYLLFVGQTLDDAWIRVRSGDFTALRSIPLLQSRSQTYMRLDLASCPTCDSSRFLTVRAFYPSAFSGDKPVEELFVPFHELSAEEVGELRELAGESEANLVS